MELFTYYIRMPCRSTPFSNNRELNIVGAPRGSHLLYVTHFTKLTSHSKLEGDIQEQNNYYYFTNNYLSIRTPMDIRNTI